MTQPSSKTRPNMLLWLVSKFVLIIIPLAMAIGFIPLAFGIQPDGLIFIGSSVLAYLISNFYDSLTLEVRDYLQERQNDQARN